VSCPRDRLVTYLDEYLGVDEWEEKSLNGLQVEGVAEVDRVALATDAALATFAMAVEAGAGFLIVHHGLFWGSV
jgi:putative NIF3 family GTP cyclohydrolase 1 type 2